MPKRIMVVKADRIVWSLVLAAAASGVGCRDTASNPNSRASAASPTPATTSAASTAAPDARSAGAVGLVVDTVTIWLNSTSMQDAVHRIGPTSLARTTEGIAIFACYKLTKGLPTFVTLEAHGGETAPVTTVEFGRGVPTSPVGQCAPLQVADTLVAPTLGFRLGWTRVAVNHVLGAPIRVDHGVEQYVIHADSGKAESIRSRPTLVALIYHGDTLVGATVSKGNEFLEEAIRR